MSVEIKIRKQKIRIKAANEQQAFMLRKQVNDQLQYELYPVYEAVFGDIQGDLYIDKLKLDLGKCTRNELIARVPELLKNELLKLVRNDERFYAHSVKQSASEKKSKEKTHQRTDDLLAIIYFLEKGIFPWWFDKKEMLLNEIITGLAETGKENLVLKLISKIKSVNEEAAHVIKKRFVNQVQKDVLADILWKFILQESDNAVKENINLLLSGDVPLNLSSFFSLELKEYYRILFYELTKHLARQKAFTLQNFIVLLNSKEDQSKEINSSAANRTGGDYKINNNLENRYMTALPQKLKEITKRITVQKNEIKKEQLDLNSDQHPDGSSKKYGIKKLIKENYDESLFGKEGSIYISNAGLVIFHPFLAQLFSELKLLTIENLFKNEECEFKAIMLLHYLCTGSVITHEPAMAFNKIICGLKPEDVIPDKILLTEIETTECDKLLDIIIDYWTALKGTSRDALRETFLMRQGKLSFNGENYLLRVEKNATDILIEKLPWGIGMMKLSWLDYLIYTEW